MEARKKADAIKAVEKQLKDDKVAEAERSVSLPSYPPLRPLESEFTDNLSPSDGLVCVECRKKQAHKERKERIEEKKRLEEMAAKMSAKKLQRMKKVRRLPDLALPPSPPRLF